MSFKDILVVVDNSKHCRARLAVASRLARRCEAHLAGLYIMPPLAISPFLADQFPQEVIDTMQADAAAKLDEAKEAFDSAVHGGGFPTQWLEDRGDPIELATLYARHVDLVVLGQPDESEPAKAIGSVMPEPLVLGSGRPALVVPYSGDVEAIGDRVVVAWNGSPQAARAVNDAIPLLRIARSVVVLSVDPEGSSGAPTGEAGLDIVAHLARHGITAERRRAAAGATEAGDMLLSRAADEGADLIVMGVWGHSRLRELALGGVSRHLFRHMTVPLFMSH